MGTAVRCDCEDPWEKTRLSSQVITHLRLCLSGENYKMVPHGIIEHMVGYFGKPLTR
jgi:hypothetical protein